MIFQQCDTTKPDGFYVQIERKIEDDTYAGDDGPKVGVRALAKCMIVEDGVGTFVNIESPGVWGIDSDSDEDYLQTIYEDEVEELKGTIARMHDPIYEEQTETV